MVNLISLTSLSRLLYMTSLAIVIGVGGYYVDYLRENNINKNNEIACISLIIFSLVFLVIGLRNILNYTMGPNAIMLLNVFFIMGLIGSLAFTAYFYYQDNDKINDEYTSYFYTILIFAGISVLLLIGLVLFDHIFVNIDRKYIDMDSKKIALRQTKERLEYAVSKLNIKKDKDMLETYKTIISDIDNGINNDNVDKLILNASYLYGEDQFVMNVLLSDNVVHTDKKKKKFNYKEAFDKMEELKENNTHIIKLNNIKSKNTEDYNYNDIYRKYIVELTSNKGSLSPLYKFSIDHCSDLLAHLPVIHGAKQEIIKDVSCGG
jgi:hypothetical protein